MITVYTDFNDMYDETQYAFKELFGKCVTAEDKPKVFAVSQTQEEIIKLSGIVIRQSYIRFLDSTKEFYAIFVDE